ncbi:hypothetical protein CDAR_590571 [Caerostris darwini]|uniref:Uncharacterized protein n=1 Tax=Caerostris darwini TaxID=1538125 RepID=A0AAV4TNL7_9ARAC|nr:hypothetical protein CDAR_590571 [Caerostris darwini]
MKSFPKIIPRKSFSSQAIPIRERPGYCICPFPPPEVTLHSAGWDEWETIQKMMLHQEWKNRGNSARGGKHIGCRSIQFFRCNAYRKEIKYPSLEL